eukprot:m.53697 g.53697  ORF g.53697 m.53697 type:complete len:613 (-) comp11055_c0_seq1:108-1946(-)
MEGGDSGIAARLSVLARRKWRHIISEKVGGGVCHAVMDLATASIFNFLGITISFLKSTGVHKVYLLDDLGAPLIENKDEKLLYIAQNTVECIEMIANQLRNPPVGVRIYMVIMPYLDGVGEIMLEEMGVYGIAGFIPFSLPMFPIDTNTLSTGNESSSVDYMLFNDTSMLSQLAVALNALKETIGCDYSHTVCIGSTAQELFVLMTHLSAASHVDGEEMEENGKKKTAKKCKLVLFDRRVDMVSPLCSQLVYAGMVHDTLGLTCVQCRYENNEGKEEKLSMSAYTDVVFPRIRDVNFSLVPMHLRKMLKELGEDYKGKDADDMEKLKEFVKGMRDMTEKHKLVSQHMWVASQCVERRNNDTTSEILEAEAEIVTGMSSQGGVKCMEELMCRPQYPNDALRLLALIRLTRRVKAVEYEKWCRLYLDAFGDDGLVALSVLDELLANATSTTTFESLRKRFSVLHEDDTAPQVFYGMQPISTQLIAEALGVTKESDLIATQKRMGTVPISLETATSSPPSKGLNERRKKGQRVAEEEKVADSGEGVDQGRRRRRAPLEALDTYDCVVCFIGGVSFSELSHLRHTLKERNQVDRTLIITTGMVSGSSIIKRMREMM